MKPLALVITACLLTGCATLQQPETLTACATADALTTVYGHHAGKLAETNPLWKTTVNAGHYLPFLAATALFVYLVIQLDNPTVTATSSAVLCADGIHNATIIGKG